MAPKFDNSGSNSLSAAGTSLSWNHTCAGGNRYFFVAVSFLNTSITNVSVTYNGVSMSQLEVESNSDSRRTYLFGLKNPASGTNSVSVTWTTSAIAFGTSISYTAVNQNVSVGAALKTNGTTAASTSLSPVTIGNSIAVGVVFAHRNSSTTIPTTTTNQSGQTQRVTESRAFGSSAARQSMSDRPRAGSTTTVGWSLANNTSFNHIAVSLNGDGGAGFWGMF